MNIIFDLDGTLFQTARCEISAINTLFDELRLKRLIDSEITNGIGKKTDDFLRGILPESILPDEVRDRFRALEHECIEKEAALFPNVSEMLTALKSGGNALFICSNGSEEYIRLVLTKTGISGFFDGICSAKTFGSKAEAVNSVIADNRRSIMVGDTFSDVDAAKKNGIPSIGAMYGYGSAEELSAATFFAEKAEDIVGITARCNVFFDVAEKIFSGDVGIIGINGVDTSGKTLFTDGFSRFLADTGIQNTVLHIDDFHNPREIRSSGSDEKDAYYRNAFNYGQVISEVLKPLKDFGFIDKDVICLDLDTDRYEKAVHYSVGKNDVLLIEGVLLFREPLESYFDKKIFLDISFDEVLKRAEIRDVPKYGAAFLTRYSEKYIPIQKRYLDEYKPTESADILIDNNNFDFPKII